MKTQKIVIVGGGSAGWMAAATVVAIFPEKEIIVIESPSVARVGVGESTLQLFRTWMALLGLSDKEFMPACDATYKLSIKFTDFHKEDDHEGFHYPFGSPHFFKDGRYGLNDWRFKKAIYRDTPRNDYAKTFYPQMALIEKGKFDLNKEGKYGEWKPAYDSAFHFDAIKFANWLRDNYCVPRGVKHISQTVETINKNDDGIESLVLDSGEVITADLYIDCTGFKSLLIGETLQEEFISFADQLPNNRAWATRVPYTDKETEMNNYTNSTAIDHGWVWNTPTWTRIGMGYVYSDRYVTKEEALEEFKEHIRSLGKSEDIINNLEFRDIPFRVGIHKRTWVKNCVALGLAAGFIEPLESNGLLTTHEFALRLVRFLGRENITQYDRDCYNAGIFKYFCEFADFVSAHYLFSQRRNNQYWKDTENLPLHHRGLAALGAKVTAHAQLNDSSNEYDDGMNFISIGMGYDRITPSMVKEIEFYHGVDLKKHVDNLDSQWAVMKNKLDEFAGECLSHYEFLKKHIYYDHPDEETTSQTGTGA